MLVFLLLVTKFVFSTVINEEENVFKEQSEARPGILPKIIISKFAKFLKKSTSRFLPKKIVEMLEKYDTKNIHQNPQKIDQQSSDRVFYFLFLFLLFSIIVTSFLIIRKFNKLQKQKAT